VFALHVVRAGVVDVHYSKLFAHLQKFREQADYGPLLALAHEDVAKDLATVKEFAGLVERFWGLPRERNEAGCRTPAGGSRDASGIYPSSCLRESRKAWALASNSRAFLKVRRFSASS
jgi:hypothetical protein